jgi:hypothetical protein
MTGLPLYVWLVLLAATACLSWTFFDAGYADTEQADAWATAMVDGRRP